MPRDDAFCDCCYGWVEASQPGNRCPHCGSPVVLKASRQLHRPRITLSWQEPPLNRGRFRRTVRPLGTSSYVRATEADLWVEAQQLLAQGYSITITPATPEVIDAEAYGHSTGGAALAVIDVAA